MDDGPFGNTTYQPGLAQSRTPNRTPPGTPPVRLTRHPLVPHLNKALCALCANCADHIYLSEEGIWYHTHHYDRRCIDGYNRNTSNWRFLDTEAEPLVEKPQERML